MAIRIDMEETINKELKEQVTFLFLYCPLIFMKTGNMGNEYSTDVLSRFDKV